MEMDKDLDATISQALMEVERDPSLPNNTLVDTMTDNAMLSPPERKTSLVVC